jgi:hypothetical protein
VTQSPRAVLPRRSDPERGVVSIVALFVALALGGLSFGLLQSSLASRKTFDRAESNVRALEAAETGFVRAEIEVASLVDPHGDGVGTLTGTHGGASFEVTATQDPDAPDRWTLVSRGTSRSSTRTLDECVRRTAHTMFPDALLSRNSLVFGGKNQTDAYDSRLGTYASQAVHSDSGGTYALEGGDIGSNSGFIQLNGSSVYVRGDAIPGPLHTVTDSGNPTVTGDTTPRKNELDLPPPKFSEFEAALATNDNGNWVASGGNLAYDAAERSLEFKSGGVLTMPGGTYFFSELKVSGGARIEFAGPTKIYVTGSIDLSGGVLVNSGPPTNLLVFAHPYPLPADFTPIVTTAKVKGGSHAGWAFYGPAATLEIGGGTGFWGAATAGQITISGNCYFHYDLALETVGILGPASIERLHWRESTLPRR